MSGATACPRDGGGRTTHRLFGTFPRILARYVRERATLDLGTAVHKMTGLPASAFGLVDRGRITPGYVADLVAFNLEQIADSCDYRDPVHPPTGIAWVMQAGEPVVADGRWLGVRRGKRLSRG